MKARHHEEDSGEHGIDLAPMLDFVLNLLIFFIITTSFVKEAGVVVSRPNADSFRADSLAIRASLRPAERAVSCGSEAW